MLSPAREPDAGARSRTPGPGRRATVVVLLAILVVAALLRMAGLTRAPPGLNQDEAANAWNAWCLLKTGEDQYGVPWPLFYARMLGENRSAIHLYAILPFQAVGGLNVWTTRLAFALGGVLTVLLVYRIGVRLFDRWVGLVAAGLLAVNPWHIELSRLGIEAALAPLLVCVGVAAMLWAGIPPTGAEGRPRAWKALLAGLLAGGVCYGYAAVRLFLPLWILGGAVATWRRPRRRGGRRAWAGFVVGFAVTFGPLAYQHVAHPEQIARRTENIRLWSDGDSVLARAGKVAWRYVQHFGPGFLFAHGDRYEVYSAHGWGVFQWYMVPLMVVGLVAAAGRAWGWAAGVPGDKYASRLLLVWVVLYPVADCLYRHDIHQPDGSVVSSLHALRSASGLAGLVLLAAIGTVAAARWVWSRSRKGALAAAGVLSVAMVAVTARFMTFYVGENTRRPAVYHGFHADLMQACAWLRSRVAEADAVFITATDMNMPYIVTLVGLGYDPEEWRAAERDVRTFEGHEWEYYFRVGKLHFVHDRTSLAALTELQSNDTRERVIFIMRPGELRLDNPTHTIFWPDGHPVLLIYDVLM